jgi:hypothetical protein
MRHPRGVYYVLGKLMSYHDEVVDAAISSAVMAAVYRGYELPAELVEFMEAESVITPEWVSEQLDLLVGRSFKQAPEDAKYYDSEPPPPST